MKRPSFISQKDWNLLERLWVRYGSRALLQAIARLDYGLDSKKGKGHGMKPRIIRKFVLVLGIATALQTQARAMGNQPPRPASDPATWGDVQAVQSQVTANATAEQLDASNLQNQTDKLSALKCQVGSNVRLYDAKHYSVNFFGLYDVKGTGGNAVGARIDFKLGKSYEQRLIEKQQQQINYLLGKLADPSIRVH